MTGGAGLYGWLAAHIPMPVPPRPLFAERLPSVLSVISLVFNEGYIGQHRR